MEQLFLCHVTIRKLRCLSAKFINNYGLQICMYKTCVIKTLNNLLYSNTFYLSNITIIILVDNYLSEEFTRNEHILTINHRITCV